MTVQDEHQDDAIAAYASLEGAERAAAHLVSCGYDEQNVRIGPRDYELMDQHPLRSALGRWLRRGLAVGTATATVGAIGAELGWEALTESVVPVAVWGAVIGTVVGLVIALIAHRLHQARTFLLQRGDLEPTRFEIVAEHDSERARNDLARWWDPEAPTAGWHPSA